MKEICPVGLRIDRVELKRNPVGLKEICPVGLRIDRVEIEKNPVGLNCKLSSGIKKINSLVRLYVK